MNIPPLSIKEYTLYSKYNNIIRVKNSFDEKRSVVQSPFSALNLVALCIPMHINDKQKVWGNFITSLHGNVGVFNFVPVGAINSGVVYKNIVSYNNTIRTNVTLGDVTNIAVGDWCRVNTQLLMVIAIDGNNVELSSSVRVPIAENRLHFSTAYGAFVLRNKENLVYQFDKNGLGDEFVLEAIEKLP